MGIYSIGSIMDMRHLMDIRHLEKRYFFNVGSVKLIES